MQHERQSLGRREGIEHDEQRETDGVGEECLLLGTALVHAGHDGIGHVHLQRLLTTRPASAQHVQADT